MRQRDIDPSYRGAIGLEVAIICAAVEHQKQKQRRASLWYKLAKFLGLTK